MPIYPQHSHNICVVPVGQIDEKLQKLIPEEKQMNSVRKNHSKSSASFISFTGFPGNPNRHTCFPDAFRSANVMGFLKYELNFRKFSVSSMFNVFKKVKWFLPWFHIHTAKVNFEAQFIQNWFQKVFISHRYTSRANDKSVCVCMHFNRIVHRIES